MVRKDRRNLLVIGSLKLLGTWFRLECRFAEYGSWNVVPGRTQNISQAGRNYWDALARLRFALFSIFLATRAFLQLRFPGTAAGQSRQWHAELPESHADIAGVPSTLDQLSAMAWIENIIVRRGRLRQTDGPETIRRIRDDSAFSLCRLKGSCILQRRSETKIAAGRNERLPPAPVLIADSSLSEAYFQEESSTRL